MTFVVSPGKTHVVGRTHLCSQWSPGELVVFGVPLGLGGDAGAAEDSWAAVVECDGVIGEPGAEGFAPADGYVFGEAAFELHEEERAGGECWLRQGTGGGGRGGVEWIEGCGVCARLG